jgi:Ran GTPase-activating protein (RanGAP) involved in mRNA processing and transport
VRAGNQIGDEGAKALAEALKTNETITTVNLSGVRVVCGVSWLRLTFHWMRLQGNPIGDEGAKALAEALKTNKSVTNIYLYGARYNLCLVDVACACRQSNSR